jgi:hypothetical protein
MIPPTTPGVSTEAIQRPGNDSSIPKGRMKAGCPRGDAILVAGAAVARLRAAMADRAPGGPALEQAVQKVTTCAVALSSADGLDSAMARMLELQSKQTGNQVKASEAQIRTTYERASRETQKRTKALRELIEAEKDKGLWDNVVGWFKDAFTCLSAAVAACTGGGVGCVAAAMMIASVVVARTKKDQEGMWISMGLGMGGGLLAGGAASAATDKAVQVGNEAVQGGVAIPKALAESDRLNAEAKLLDVRATKEMLKDEAEQEREMLKAAIEAQNRGVSIVLKLMTNNQRVAETATTA